MKRIFSILFAVVLVLSFSLIPATPAAAADLNVPSPHSTIQDAIDAASSSDTIIVAAGTYEEDLVIPEGLDNLTLAGTSGAIIKGVAMTLATSWPTVAPNIDIRADGVTISGFTIRGPDVNPGSYSSGICIGGSDVEIYGNDFEVTNTADAGLGDIGQAIQTYNKLAIPGVDISGLNIHDNTFTSYGGGGIGFEAIYINRDEGNGGISIASNEFSGYIFRGITTERSNTSITGNSLVTDVSVSVAWQGILVRGAEAQDNVSVVANVVSGFSDGVRVGKDGQVLTNISIVSNDISDSIKGIRVLTAEDVAITGNTVSDTVGGADSVAISVESVESAAILANTVSEFEKGGIVVKDTVAVQIEDNDVSTAVVALATNGIQVGYVMDYTATTGTVNNNVISGCHWYGYDPETETYEDTWTGSGILVIAPDSALTISGNEVQNCDVGLDIEAGSGTAITNNDVHDNSYGFVLWNADPTINFNSIYENSLCGVYRTTDPYSDPSGILDATENWWGDCSGPSGAGSGSGDAVSANVLFDPWLGKSLSELRAAIDALDGEDFKKRGWGDQQESLLFDKIDAVCGQYGDGAYRGALNKLERDITRAIQRWIVTGEQTALIDMVDAEITILLNFQ